MSAEAVIEITDSNLAKNAAGFVNVPAKNEEKALITDEALIGIYSDIMEKVQEDRNQITDVLDQFLNMVVNEGDASSASKEAVVNLIKAKSDQADKMTRVADLMTRLKLKEKDTFPKYMAQNIGNTQINVGSQDKRSLLEAIAKAQKKTGQNE